MPLRPPFAGRQNTVLVPQNAMLPGPDDELDDPPAGGVAGAIAKRRLAEREERLAKLEEQYVQEVRRLLDAGLAVMRSCGMESSPRVAAKVVVTMK